MKEENEKQSQKPDYVAYNVQETQDGKGIWNRVGAAWEHKDGRGLDLSLNSFPVNGRVTLRELRDERMQDYSEERKSQKPTRHNEPKRNFTRSR